ncbi:MAG: hypothetical protein ACR2N5_03795 [Solirubrobacterales bacterium]
MTQLVGELRALLDGPLARRALGPCGAALDPQLLRHGAVPFVSNIELSRIPKRAPRG